MKRCQVFSPYLTPQYPTLNTMVFSSLSFIALEILYRRALSVSQKNVKTDNNNANANAHSVPRKNQVKLKPIKQASSKQLPRPQIPRQ